MIKWTISALTNINFEIIIYIYEEILSIYSNMTIENYKLSFNYTNWVQTWMSINTLKLKYNLWTNESITQNLRAENNAMKNEINLSHACTHTHPHEEKVSNLIQSSLNGNFLFNFSTPFQT